MTLHWSVLVLKFASFLTYVCLDGSLLFSERELLPLMTAIMFNVSLAFGLFLDIFILYVIHSLITPKHVAKGEIQAINLIEVKKQQQQLYSQLYERNHQMTREAYNSHTQQLVSDQITRI